MPHHVDADTGVSDVTYDVLSLLANKLEGLEAMAMYREDAEEADDKELAELIDQMEEQDRKTVQKLKSMLAKRLK